MYVTQSLFNDMKNHFKEDTASITFNFEQTLKQGFFPACTGTIDGNIDIGKMDTLILGQDFGSLGDYNRRVKNKGEFIEKQSTWKQLIPMLENLGLDSKKSFYSNYLMGLRKDEGNVGISPGISDHNYLKLCNSFLEQQVRVIRPKVIVFLGKVSFGLSKGLSEPEIRNLKFIKKIREENIQKPNIKIGGKNYPCIYLIHPSFRLQQIALKYWDLNDEVNPHIT